MIRFLFFKTMIFNQLKIPKLGANYALFPKIVTIFAVSQKHQTTIEGS